MPPLGFLGFPVFALEAWVMYSALCALRVAVPVTGEQRVARGRSVVAGVGAAVFAVATLIGMERFTNSSTVPRLGDLPGLTTTSVDALDRGGVRTPRQLAAATAPRVAALTGADRSRANAVIESARLVMLRGIGTADATALDSLGVDRVCDLVGRDADSLSADVRSLTRRVRPTAPEVRVWIRAAHKACPERSRP
jgi:hypothetical protein